MNWLSDVESWNRGSGGGGDLDVVFGWIDGRDIRAGTGEDHSFSGMLE